MGNRVLKTGLLSLTAASLLTTGAFAFTVSGTDNAISGSAFKKLGGRLDVAKITVQTDYIFEITNLEVNVTQDVNDTESYLQTVKLFGESLNEENKIAEKTITLAPKDENATTKDANVVFTASDFSNANSNFLTFEAGKNLYVALQYGAINSATGKDSTITVKAGNLKVVATDDENNTGDSNITFASRSFTIDRTAPTLQSISSALSTGFNTPTVTLKFSEPVKINGGTTAAKDGKADAISVTSHTVSTTDTNATTITLGSELNSTLSGDVYVSYTDNQITDIFGNLAVLDRNVSVSYYDSKNNKSSSRHEVVALATGVKAYDDNTSATIEAVHVDFDTKSSGYVLFTEEVKTPALWNIKNNNGATLTFGTAEESSNKTKVPFTITSGSITDLDLYFKDGNSTTSVIDYGENNSTSSEGNYTPKHITTLSIKEGWNLIALNSQTRTTSERVIKSGAVEMIWGYDNDNGKWNRFPQDIKAGHGYWVKGNKNFAEFNNSKIEYADLNDETAKAYDVNNSTVIKNAGKTGWALVGTKETNLTWAEAYSQVADGCYGVSVYAYDNGNGWNSSATGIPANSGVWVKQDCDNEYNIGQ
jgi:hypothetical protein